MYKAIKGKTVLPGFMAMMAVLLSACATGSSPNARDIADGSDYDLSDYQRVMIDPVNVGFDPDWEPVPTGSHLSMSRPEREKVAEDVAEMFNAAFAAELAASGNIEIVDRAGPGVLRISPSLQDVYLSAPLPLQRPGSTYVRNVGHMALHLVFRDAASGEQVLELHDYVRGRDIGLLRPASSVFNETELRRIFEDWAQVIRQDLFRAP